MGKNRIRDNFDFTKKELRHRERAGQRAKLGKVRFQGFVSPLSTFIFAGLFLWGCGKHQVIITKDPLKAAEHLKLAQIYEAKGETELATREYKTALELDDTNPMAYFGLGNISYNNGKHRDAENYYKKAIKNTSSDDPKIAMFYNNLSWVYIDSDSDLKAAKQLAQKAVHMDSKQRYIYLDTLGVICTKLKQFTEAEEALLSALHDAPNDKTALRHINIHLFELYELTGERKKLQNVLERLQELGK